MSSGTEEDLRFAGLPGGVRLVSERMPTVRSVSVGFWINCGSRDELDPLGGATHFLEHLLFKGTARRTAKEIAEALEAVGGDLNAFTAKEHTCFYARCLDRDLPLAIDVLADMITSASLNREDVDAERGVVLEEIRMLHDTPDDLVHSVFSQAVFGPHPLGREVLGEPEAIRAVDREQIHGHYHRRYVPSNLVVAVAGNIEHEAVQDLVGEVLDSWEPAPAAPVRTLAPIERPAYPVRLRKRSTEQAHVCVGGLGLRRSDERRFAAMVLNHALGGGMASRLFQEVRERRGLAYSVYSYLSLHAEGGSHAVYAGTAAHQVDTVLGLVRDELARVLTDGLTDKEVADAKGSLVGSTLLGLEDTGSRMTRLGKALISDVPLLSLDETIAAIDGVTRDDLVGVARLLYGGELAVGLVGPFDEQDPDRWSAYAKRLAA